LGLRLIISPMAKTAKDSKIDNIRHSLAHLLAAAVLKRFPKAKLGIGPVIENGFYYDFLINADERGLTQIKETDLPEIEKEMRRLIRMNLLFTGKKITPAEAKKLFSAKGGSASGGKDQPFKLELVKEFIKEKKPLTVYKTGDVFVDLCKGGHIKNTSEIRTDAFKLTHVAGAYWRGDEKNPQLQRVYGLAFETKKELEEYLWQQEEIKKWDHRKIGKELDLFSFHEEGPGFVFWHPKGMLLREALMKAYGELQKSADYKTVSTPILLSEELWRRSGHWDNYKDKMYFTKIDNRSFAIKPMNCPGVILIYKDQTRSWRDLPLRLSETGEVHRHEPSGTLHGLFRVRAFRQDDAHIFALEDQIEEEVKSIINLIIGFYKIIGFSEIELELSTRPEKYIGEEKIWTKAESIFKKVLRGLALKFKINEGDGAFYGPKIDFHVKDAMGRRWQCGTIQLDFFMPERFGLEYVDKDGSPKRPVMIHRTIIGSIQRFTGIIIEHFHGAFPLWLAPLQITILPVSEKFSKYAEKVSEELRKENIRVEISVANETLGKRIREAEMKKIPYVLVVGEREEKNKTVSVRKRGSAFAKASADAKTLADKSADKQDGEILVEKLIEKIKKEIENKVI